MLKTTTPFLRHTLMLGGKPMGQLLIDKYRESFPAYAKDMAETMAHYPPTPVSILEFEATMREIRNGK